MGSPGGTPAVDVRLVEDAWRDMQPMRVACAWCGWTHEGAAGEARQAAAEHRRAAHPEIRTEGKRLRRVVDAGLSAPWRSTVEQRDAGREAANAKRRVA